MPYTAHPVWSFAPNWSQSVLETLEFKTNVLVSEVRVEQRVSRRLTPRKYLEASFLIHSENRQYFQSLIKQHGASLWMIPLWHEVGKLTAAVSIGIDTLNLDTRWCEYRVGGHVVLRDRRNARVWEVLEIEAVTDSSLTLISNTEKAWTIGNTYVYPGVLAALTDTVAGSKKLAGVFDMRSKFAVRQINHFPSNWAPALYKELEVFDQRPDDSQDLTFEYQRAVETIDSEIGIPKQIDVSQRAILKFAYRWTFSGREENYNVRRFLYWMRGRQKSCWIPTFMEDLTLASAVGSGDDLLTISNIGYTANEVIDLWKDLRIQLRNGTVIYTRITAAVEIDANTEELTLENPITPGFSVADVVAISYMTVLRLDQDSIEIDHSTDSAGATSIAVSFIDPPVPEAPTLVGETDYGTFWTTQKFDMDATNVFEVYAPPIFLEDEGIMLQHGYDGGANFRVKRFDAADYSLIGDVTSLDDQYATEWDVGMAVDDPDGYVWISSAHFDGKTYRITKSDWSLVSPTRDPVTPPSGYGYLSGVPLTTGYYYFFVNPFDNAIYCGDQSDFGVMHRIDKTDGNFNPDQSYYMAGSGVGVTSPYSGVVDTASYYGATPSLQMGPIVFISATEAYMRDYNTSNIFHVNLTTGVFTYVFRIVGGSGLFTGHYPVYYDTATNTLWFFGYNGSYSDYVGGTSIFFGVSFKSWVVGSGPATMQNYPVVFDIEMQRTGTVGDQTIPAIYNIIMLDKFNKGAWVGTQLGGGDAYFEIVPTQRFFSFVSKTLTDVAGDTTPVEDTNFAGAFNANSGYSGNMVSATAGWFSPVANYIDFVDRSSVKMTKATARAVPTARYLRITIYATSVKNQENVDYHASGLGGPVGLQCLEVRSDRGGANVAISATASTSDPSYPATNLLGGDSLDIANSWRANDLITQTITLDMGVSVPLYEVAMWPLNNRLFGVNPGYEAVQYYEARFCSPAIFKFETSDDGSTWASGRKYHAVVAWASGVVPGTDVSAARIFEVF